MLTDAQRAVLTEKEWDDACILMGTLAIKHIDDKFIGVVLESLARSRILSEARRKMLKKCEGLLGVCKPGIATDGDYDKIKLEIYGLRNEILDALAKEG